MSDATHDESTSTADHDRDDTPPTGDAGGSHDDRTDRGREEGYHGDAVTENPMAPASAGVPHGGGGVVDPRSGGPDRRPVVPEGRPSGGEEDASEETPVASPVDRTGEGVDSGSGSAGAASRAAGSRAAGADGQD